MIPSLSGDLAPGIRTRKYVTPAGSTLSKARALIAGAPLNSKNLAATKTVGQHL